MGRSGSPARRAARSCALLLAAAAACLAAAAQEAVPAAPATAAAPAEDRTSADVNHPLSPSGEAALRINEALRANDAKAALAIADAFLAGTPRDAQVRFLRAVVLGDLQRTDEATAALEALTQDYPELPEPYNNLAVIRAHQGELASAEHLLQLAIAAQPGYVTARENLGDLYVSLAAAAYEQGLKLEPGNAVLQKKLTLARDLGTSLRAAR
jgi:Flp pilus assembly protein TadD